MTPPDDLDDLDAVAILTDPVRRQAYRLVAGGSAPVGRDEVAEALGVGRTLAAFHLDKLVGAGLLETSYARRSGKTGPGAGRPAKLYHVAAGEHVVSVPPRAYGAAAEMLAEALERAGVEDVLGEVAERHGRRAGAAGGGARFPAGRGDGGLFHSRPGAESVQFPAGPSALFHSRSGADVSELLAEQGYAPQSVGPERIELRNCPFHRLAEQFPPVICGMNLALVTGLLAGAGVDSEWTARMDAAPGRCCVTLAAKSKNQSD